MIIDLCSQLNFNFVVFFDFLDSCFETWFLFSVLRNFTCLIESAFIFLILIPITYSVNVVICVLNEVDDSDLNLCSF